MATSLKEEIVKMLLVLIAAIMFVGCGSDVTGPEDPTTPPDTTWEHTVTLRIEVTNTVESPNFSAYWLQDGEVQFEAVYDLEWELEFEGHSGDSLWVSGIPMEPSSGEQWLLATIYVDGAWTSSSGAPAPDATVECSYVIQ